MVVYTSSSYILKCERISWTVGPNNDRTATLKDSDGCCRRIDNFDSSNQQYLEHNITPTNGQCPRLQTTEKVNKKLVASIRGTSAEPDQFCLLAYICHPSRNGLLVLCRQEATGSTWIAIGELLVNLLSSLNIVIPSLKQVNQSDCIFHNTCVV